MHQPVIFLDIDGVLVTGTPRPSSAPAGLAASLAEKHSNPLIASLPDILCAQVLDNFNPKACSNLEKLCQETGARIVISSSWRLFHSLEHLQAIFSLVGIHHIHDTVSNGSVRRDVIASYVQNNRVGAYIILDDMDLSRVFGYRFIWCRSGFMEREYSQALSALQCQSQ